MDLAAYSRFVVALIAVLALIVILAFIARRIGFGASTGASAWRRGARRLGVIESLTLDPKNRLLLIRRDGREHLLLIGATGSLLVESMEDDPRPLGPAMNSGALASPLSATEAAS